MSKAGISLEQIKEDLMKDKEFRIEYEILEKQEAAKNARSIDKCSGRNIIIPEAVYRELAIKQSGRSSKKFLP